MQSNELSQIIAKRRSIKPALMDPARAIPQELWEQLFEAANWAPTHGLTEPWRFDVFAGDKRQLVADALQASYKSVTPEAEFRPEKFEKMGKNPFLANSVVIVSMHLAEGSKIPEVEEAEAVACAVQNLHLLASELGLGVFWSSPAVSYSSAFEEALELGDKQKCLGMLYVGWPREGLEWPVSKRGNAMDKVTFR
ncbi:nitroreductase family protein [Rubritalea marina]|uniref:nitroreductase family protein n=1 Tax=Rubritalea marina TaxID=361055 RepID=UPI00035D3E95|nr:nitroreductase [Rubritalea marina]